MEKKSVYLQTIQQLDNRIAIYDHYGIPLESQAFRQNFQGIYSVSQKKGELCYYDFETSINPLMKNIYESHDLGFRQKKKLLPVLEPPSEGEESITQNNEFEPSFKWLVNRLVDSSLLKFDTPEPKKVENSKQAEDWTHTQDLILFGISNKVFEQWSNDACSNYVSSKLQRFEKSIKFRKCQQIFYKGECAILLRFRNQVSAQFAYYNISRGIKVYQDEFGNDTKLGRVVEYRLKDKKDDWVAMVLRKLTLNITKQNLTNILKKADIKITWVEDIVEIGDWRYALIGVETLEDVFKTAEYFKNNTVYKQLKQLKVNLHPQSKKIWVKAIPQLEQK